MCAKLHHDHAEGDAAEEVELFAPGVLEDAEREMGWEPCNDERNENEKRERPKDSETNFDDFKSGFFESGQESEENAEENILHDENPQNRPTIRRLVLFRRQKAHDYCGAREEHGCAHDHRFVELGSENATDANETGTGDAEKSQRAKESDPPNLAQFAEIEFNAEDKEDKGDAKLCESVDLNEVLLAQKSRWFSLCGDLKRAKDPP